MADWTDPIHPAHYHGTKVDEFIEEFRLGFRPGNAVKYIARYQEKGAPIQDLKKAIWYLEREVSRLEELGRPLLDASCDRHQWRGRNDERCPGCIAGLKGV